MAKITVDELLVEQSKTRFLATIEPAENGSGLLKVTPWIKGGGCLCSFAFEIRKDKIASVETTGEKHYCCDQLLIVVEITFASNASLTYDELFGNFLKNVKHFTSKPHEHTTLHFQEPQRLQNPSNYEGILSHHASQQYPGAYTYFSDPGFGFTSNQACPGGMIWVKCPQRPRGECVPQGSLCCGEEVCHPPMRCIFCPGYQYNGGFRCLYPPYQCP